MSDKQAKRQRRDLRRQQQLNRRVFSRRVGWTAVAAVGVVAALVGGALIATRSSGAAPVTTHATGGDVTISGRDPITGRAVSLASYRGRPIVLNVWGSWCEGCQAEARDLAAFARAHPEAEVIGIDTQDTEAGARAFYRRYGWHHPSIFDPHGDIAARLAIQGTPTTFFLDRSGHPVAQIVGATTLAGFEQGLRAVTKTA